jgi:hypothetical protein
VAHVNPFVFVVGCPRSGTTLLQRLLDAHPELSVINETLWITREAKAPVTPELVSRLFEDRRFRRLELAREAVELLVQGNGAVSYRNFVSAVFDLYGSIRGKSLVGDKSPGYVRKIPKLHALFPKAKFVHLIRDGREVWLSVQGWKKGERSAGQVPTWTVDPLGSTALWWERSVRLGREAGAVLGDNLYREVRYEAVVRDPERECRDLCDFLEISYSDAMLRFHEGRARYDLGITAKRAWLPPLPGLRNWRAEMAVADVERFEAIVGDLLDELGYPRMYPRVSAGAAQKAGATRSAFTEDARARRRDLPERWLA